MKEKPPAPAKPKWGMLLLLFAAATGVSYGLVFLLRGPAESEPANRPPAMRGIAGGQSHTGTTELEAWNDGTPAHGVRIDGFWIDETEVTNASFRKFVEATKYVTTAEKPPDVEELMKQLKPGTPPPAKED